MAVRGTTDKTSRTTYKNKRTSFYSQFPTNCKQQRTFDSKPNYQNIYVHIRKCKIYTYSCMIASLNAKMSFESDY